MCHKFKIVYKMDVAFRDEESCFLLIYAVIRSLKFQRPIILATPAVSAALALLHINGEQGEMVYFEHHARRGEDIVNTQCPGCNRQIQVDIVVMSMSDLEQSSDIYDAQLQLELLKVQHDHSAVLDWYRDMAEQTDMPLHALLAEALDLALPEVRRQHNLCTACGQPLQLEKE